MKDFLEPPLHDKRPLHYRVMLSVEVRVYLAEVFQDDGDIHIDDDEKADDKVRDQVGNGQTSRAAVAMWHRITNPRIVTVRLSNEKTRQDTVPAGRRRRLKQDDHALAERLEVEQLVDACRVFDVHEELHAEHGVDEHDEKQQQTDVEQRRQRHGQREQHLTSPPDRFVTSTKNLNTFIYSPKS